MKKIQPIVDEINALESGITLLSDEALRGKTQEFQDRLKKGETLDDILPEAFAVVREASKRAVGMRHFDVQMIGGVVLHRGAIAEMRTGEGKTLVATLPAYLNALEGRGVHVVTVNDYLAKRDAVWMAKIYDFLGLSVGVIQNQRISFIYDKTQIADTKHAADSDNQDDVAAFHVEDEYLRSASRKEAYACDITYGTNNEFGFDYLRDNMVQTIGDMVMRHGMEMEYCIIDEVDSILIDEARTPLIISAPAEEAADQYYQFAKLVRQLQEKDDYNVDEKMRSATLTESGIAKFEQWLGVENLYVEGGIRTVHHVEQALKAMTLFKRDKDYMVEADEVIIIDEFTGRKMIGRRYSEGLHQAIEAKEGVKIQRESQTLATITFQNLFRMYKKMAGMTGTAKTEEEELYKIYGREVLVIPTNKADQRTDHHDRIYKMNRGKYGAIVERIQECRKKSQPILIGTASVEKNEELGIFLTASGIPHEILNAKNHEREGEIIAQAGRPGRVTLATNMAGRGVDIKLGGNPVDHGEERQVIEAGGLFVLGTERHESRRIDNQLRGRAARQGDPGETQFFVSTEDDLMRIFAGDRLKAVMTRLNVPDDMPIEQKMITRMLESAQKKVEGHNFDIRKHVLEYDDVLNRHRTVMYRKRRQILELAERTETAVQLEDSATESDQKIKDLPEASSTEEKKYNSLHDMIMDLIESEIEFVVSYHTNPEKDESEWDIREIYETMRTIFPFTEAEREQLLGMGKNGDDKLKDVALRDAIVALLLLKASAEYNQLFSRVQDAAGLNEAGARSMMMQIEKSLLLRAIDMLWVEHLESVHHLRQGIGLQGYGQRDPLVEYKRETYQMFHRLLSDIQKEVVYSFFKVNIGLQLAPSIMASDKAIFQGAKKEEGSVPPASSVKTDDKVGRNDPCPCGSGKKYKRCHGG